eukprot:5995060-Prymnesium_polylepis.1
MKTTVAFASSAVIMSPRISCTRCATPAARTEASAVANICGSPSMHTASAPRRAASTATRPSPQPSS